MILKKQLQLVEHSRAPHGLSGWVPVFCEGPEEQISSYCSLLSAVVKGIQDFEICFVGFISL